ncbi:GNAT family N-acetyltransferase [Halobiforma nitratireducens]|uniref:N-acetyltransferase GCN5 n=1 Tax=Halobiforma nitratireducens JCM 10879 TaxID=1227454 RepID=M0MD97_9EURY|nr:GNAT family N-acetyltransferase [Halobiforma nitratireducens]EMA42365.1 N-acetyltransferase GCN5 [Halobiforma nitratireducens JCM 10879]
MSSEDSLEVRVAGDDDGDNGDNGDEREDAFAVRQHVFVEEQGVDEELEYDGHDADAVHVVAYDDGEPVGTARLRELEDGIGKVERVAVRESRRGEGIGRKLMVTLEERAAERGLATLTLHSQTHAAEFYDLLGYDRHGEEFEEAGIPHVEMHKRLE